MMNKIIQHLQQCDNILIASHVNPDGDAIGSSLAMGLALEGMGKTVTLFTESPIPPITKLVTPGKLLATEKFDQKDSVGTQKKRGKTGWATVLGDWKIVDGAAYGIMEPPSAKRPKGHAAGCDQLVDLDNFVMSGEFKLGDAPQVGVIMRDSNQPPLHQGRVLVTPKAIWIQKSRREFFKFFT